MRFKYGPVNSEPEGRDLTSEKDQKSLADVLKLTNRCIACSEEIQPGAKICTHCDQFQDWRRFFGISAPVLSLLVALVSVLSIAIPAILNVRPPQTSDIHCSLLEWDESTATVKLAVSNKGSRAAGVQRLLH